MLVHLLRKTAAREYDKSLSLTAVLSLRSRLASSQPAFASTRIGKEYFENVLGIRRVFQSEFSCTV